MEKSYVSLEKKICAICGNEHETNSLLLDKRMKNSMEKYTVTGYDHCNECKTKLDDDYVAMVEISNSPSEDSIMKQENANRTGKIAWVKKHVANKIFKGEITTPMVFVEPKVVEYLQSIKQEV